MFFIVLFYKVGTIIFFKVAIIQILIEPLSWYQHKLFVI